MSGLVLVGLVVAVAALAVVVAATFGAWLDERDSRELPPVNVDAEEELEHIRRRERLHVVPQSAVHEVEERALPFDWRQEGGL